MSKDTMFSNPLCWPSQAMPRTAAAGPEKAVERGCAAARSAVTTPPADFITNRGELPSSSWSRLPRDFR